MLFVEKSPVTAEWCNARYCARYCLGGPSLPMRPVQLGAKGCRIGLLSTGKCVWNCKWRELKRGEWELGLGVCAVVWYAIKQFQIVSIPLTLMYLTGYRGYRCAH